MAPHGGRGRFEIGHHQRGVRGRLDQHQLEIVHLIDRRGESACVAGWNRARVESQRLNDLMNQMLAAAVERTRVEHRASAIEKREYRGRDCREARIEHRGRVGAALERHQLIFDDLGVRVAETRVDEIGAFVAALPDLA